MWKEFDVKKASRTIVNKSHQEPNAVEVKRTLPSALGRNFRGKAVGVASGTAVTAIIALSILVWYPVRAEMHGSLAEPQLGSPPFANPVEVRSRAGEKRLRMVMQLADGTYTIPNVGSETLRQFRGWDASQPAPSLSNDPISPGPTLRARLGDMVEISFLNKIDDTNKSKFPYSFVTDSPPGQSDFGCDKAGTRDPHTGIILPYPGNDKFPNCFHGSSTANIHFHGTHTSPDGLGDNVLVQVLPQLNQPDWTGTFNQIFDSGKIPQTWSDLPQDYQTKQMELIREHDKAARAAALKNKLQPPDSLYEADQKMINAGLWPQYLMGAFPNFFQIPDYDQCKTAITPCKAGQAPGTHWYHAHKHGSTSLHIKNGLAGAFIIESSQDGGYDQVIRKFYGWGDTYGAHEKIFVFQEYDTAQNLERNPRGGGPAAEGKGSQQVLVNGKLTPTITMQPGEVQLWRLINATEGNGPGIVRNTLFQTPGFSFKQTAQDGVQFSPNNYANQPFLNANAPGGMVPGGLTIAAGNRADLLVQAPTAPGLFTFKSGGATLFLVNVVTGPPVSLPNGAFPTTWAVMPTFLNDLARPGPDDVINQNSPLKFQWEDGRTGQGLIPKTQLGFPPHFMINGKQFNQTGDLVDQCMPQDGLQDWVLENWTALAHPFHIHINPFQVIRIATPTGRDTYNVYAPANNFVWQDTVAIPPAKFSTNAAGQITNVTPGRVTIRQTYLDFTGTYVLHCHILAHEDRGMMQLVRVVPAGKYPASCQDNIPAHH
jgi:FtsP/CotA-like multicopper oxidase with cupredoxin domain